MLPLGLKLKLNGPAILPVGSQAKWRPYEVVHRSDCTPTRLLKSRLFLEARSKCHQSAKKFVISVACLSFDSGCLFSAYCSVASPASRSFLDMLYF